MFLPQVSSDYDKILKMSPTCSESGMSLKKISQNKRIWNETSISNIHDLKKDPLEEFLFDFDIKIRNFEEKKYKDLNLSDDIKRWLRYKNPGVSKTWKLIVF